MRRTRGILIVLLAAALGCGGSTAARTDAGTGGDAPIAGCGHAAGAACCAGPTCSGGLVCDSHNVCQASHRDGLGGDCSAAGDCTSGLCLPVVFGSGGGGTDACTLTCTADTDCIPGWQCLTLDGQAGSVCQCQKSATGAGGVRELCDGTDDDCDGIVDNHADATCAAAEPNTVCHNGACACAGITCNGECTDVRVDPLNCGGCNYACPIPTNGSAVCVDRMCDVSCDPGYVRDNGACSPVPQEDGGATDAPGDAPEGDGGVPDAPAGDGPHDAAARQDARHDAAVQTDAPPQEDAPITASCGVEGAGVLCVGPTDCLNGLKCANPGERLVVPGTPNPSGSCWPDCTSAPCAEPTDVCKNFGGATSYCLPTAPVNLFEFCGVPVGATTSGGSAAVSLGVCGPNLSFSNGPNGVNLAFADSGFNFIQIYGPMNAPTQNHQPFLYIQMLTSEWNLNPKDLATNPHIWVEYDDWFVSATDQGDTCKGILTAGTLMLTSLNPVSGAIVNGQIAGLVQEFCGPETVVCAGS